MDRSAGRDYLCPYARGRRDPSAGSAQLNCSGTVGGEASMPLTRSLARCAARQPPEGAEPHEGQSSAGPAPDRSELRRGDGEVFSWGTPTSFRAVLSKRRWGGASFTGYWGQSHYEERATLCPVPASNEFEVVGSHTGTRYRIKRARAMNIDELDLRGRTVARWCFAPQGNGARPERGSRSATGLPGMGQP
jgi:hypothetical protein